MEARGRAAAAAAATVIALLLVPLSVATSYGVRLVTLPFAVHALIGGAGRAGRPEGVARRLFATGLLAGVASGVAGGLHLAVTGDPTPPGALADWLYLLYPPLVALGLLRLPRHSARGRWRWRAAADAGVSASGLLFVMWPLLPGLAHTHLTTAGRAATLAYPVGAVLVLATLLSVLPQAREQVRPFLLVGGLGLLLLATSDVGYALANAQGGYRATSWPAVLGEGGLVALVVAGRAPRLRLALSPALSGVVMASVPYVGLVPALVLVLGDVVDHRPLASGQLALGLVAVLALVHRQVLAHTEQQQAMAALGEREHEAVVLARQDALTGLGNRRALLEALDAALAGPEPVVLALLDLDDFKDVNDRYGHDTGDAMLRVVAARLRGSVPAGAGLHRLGGDEFAVVASGDVHALGRTLERCLQDPVQLGDQTFLVTASTGLVVLDPGAEAGTALAHVDVAMYDAKSRKLPHLSSVTVLAGAERARATRRVQLREEVSRPDLSQFHVVYEPVVDLAGGHVVGAEALLRWRHPVLGDVGPTEFIPLAEQVGSIAVLGEFVLATALRDLAGWVEQARAAGRDTGATVGVNLSPRQLGDARLTRHVEQELARHGLSPRRLHLEITEEALLDDWSTAVEVVDGLRRLGVGVAVDDFGTGYSSLRYLRRFDTSIVKVDREFVTALPTEPRTRALVASVLDMARRLDQDTVAEGVETYEQLRVLQQLGCQFAQGYRFAKPMPAAAFGALVVTGHRYPVGVVTEVPQARCSTDGPARAPVAQVAVSRSG